MLRQLAPSLALVLLLAGCVEETPAGEAPTPAAADAPPAETVAAATAPGAAPHVHDLWEGRERMLLLESDHTVEAPAALEWAAMSTLYLGTTGAGGFFVEMPEGALVAEGAGALEVTASWSEPTVTGLRFLHRHAGSGDVQPWTVLRSAETRALEVTPDMADMPHAARSRWAFLFLAEGTPGALVGTVHLKIEAVKARDPSVYPGHPDLWGNATQLPRLDGEGATRTTAAPRFLPDPGEGFAAPKSALPLAAPVPMGATTLLVEIEVLSVTPTTRPLDALHLELRTAREMEFDFDPVDAEPAVDGARWTWRVPVEMEQTDNPYAATSAWAILVVPEYGPGLPVEAPCQCHEAELRYHARVTALREAPTGQ